MKIFVTGATGFIGRGVVRLLCGRGHELLFLVRDRRRAEAMFEGCGEIGFAEGDLRDIDSWRQVFRSFGAEAAVHLAWEGLPDYSEEVCARNVEYGRNLFYEAAEGGCRCILSAGSCWEYRRKTGPLNEESETDISSDFTAAKNSLRSFGEDICGKYGVRFYWPRIFYAYGPGQRQGSLVPHIIESLANGTEPDIRNPDNCNDFVYVADVARAIVSLVEKQPDNVIYNVGSGRSVSVRDVIATVEDVMRCTGDGRCAGHLQGLQGSEDFRADVTRIGADIGWSPQYNLVEGIRETAEAAGLTMLCQRV